MTTETTPPETDEKPAPREPAPMPKFDVPKGAEGTGRYSAYDTTYGRYVGGVHDSEAKARKAAKDKGSEDFKIVEV